MNVLQIGKYGFENAGGIEAISQCLHEYLSSLQINVFTVACGDESVLKKDYRVHQTSFSIKSQPISIGYIFNIFKKIPKSDIIIYHYPNPIIIPCILFALLFKKKLIVYFHSDIIRQKMLRWVFFPVDALIFRLCSEVWGLTEKHLEASNFRQHIGNFQVVPAILDKFPTIENKPLKLASDFARILCVGRLVGYKNFGMAIRCMTLLPENYYLDVVGTGPEFESLSTQAQELGVSKRVTFHGNLTNAELDALYRGSHVYLMCSNSRAEMFGIVQLEAALHNLPIICCNIHKSAVSYLVENFGLGEVVNCDEGSIVEAVKTIQHNTIDFDLVHTKLKCFCGKKKVLEILRLRMDNLCVG